MDGHHRKHVLDVLQSKPFHFTLKDLNKQDDFLFWAVMAGDTSIVRECLSQEVHNINRRVHKQRTALMAAAAGGQQTIYQLLLSEGADLTLTDEEGNNCLHLAVEGGSMPVVEDILSRNVLDINARGHHGHTATMVAVVNRQGDIFDVLFAAGANPYIRTDNGNDCLYAAIVLGHMTLLRKLVKLTSFDISRKDQLGRSPVMVAALHGRQPEFDYLVLEGGDISQVDEDGNDFLLLAALGGSAGIVQHLMSMTIFDINKRNLKGINPLLAAINEGHEDVFDLLLSAGGAVPDNSDCVMNSVKTGNIHIIKTLLAMKVFDLNTRDKQGWTPTMMAAMYGYVDVFQILMSEGADISLVDAYGNNCLILCSVSGEAAMVQHILSLNCLDINARGFGGMTAVMAAASEGRDDVFDVLVKAGADLCLEDDDGNNCLMLAHTGGNSTIEKFLMSTDLFNQ
ncbi:ankyrin repeat domain-containing protein 50-like [Haliotis rubra]|uniref:ankyrin repeat domain-containing protein 50-like n=1 Tax=Haliotis rubra TaxID=36100 RepID=UPI001EE5753B|nr:ankyrin repeat domain-containing protein 50-like [Haliotis rubra]